jgi:hypothetical protein
LKQSPANSITVARPVALIPVPAQRLFKMQAAAKHVGVHTQTLRKLTDEGKIRAKNRDGKRVYLLEDLNAYIESLPEWYDQAGERPEASNGDHDID